MKNLLILSLLLIPSVALAKPAKLTPVCGCIGNIPVIPIWWGHPIPVDIPPHRRHPL